MTIHESIERQAFFAKRELRRYAITLKGRITRSYRKKVKAMGEGK